MRMRTLVWREIFERKSQLATSFLAILLGITVIVSIKNITHYSEKAVAAASPEHAGVSDRTAPANSTNRAPSPKSTFPFSRSSLEPSD